MTKLLVIARLVMQLDAAAGGARRMSVASLKIVTEACRCAMPAVARRLEEDSADSSIREIKKFC